MKEAHMKFVSGKMEERDKNDMITDLFNSMLNMKKRIYNDMRELAKEREEAKDNGAMDPEEMAYYEGVKDCISSKESTLKYFEQRSVRTTGRWEDWLDRQCGLTSKKVTPKREGKRPIRGVPSEWTTAERLFGSSSGDQPDAPVFFYDVSESPDMDEDMISMDDEAAMIEPVDLEELEARVASRTSRLEAEAPLHAAAARARRILGRSEE